MCDCKCSCSKPQPPARPVPAGRGWACSRCGAGCYYDGRMGDGPIMLCKCDEAERAYWENDRR